jgi:hypothetical protein
MLLIFRKGMVRMREYASLQLLLDEDFEAAQERIIYLVTAYMDACGYVPCGRESAEHTFAFAHIKRGWVIFDDCADRLELNAFHGLCRCLTLRLSTNAVGVVGFRDGYMLRLYSEGALKDTFSTSPKKPRIPMGSLNWPGRAIRWRSVMREGVSTKELSSAFLAARRKPEEGFEMLKKLLILDDSAGYGFSSIEDAGLEGVVTLYFHAANRLRQHWLDRLLHVPAKCSGGAATNF